MGGLKGRGKNVEGNLSIFSLGRKRGKETRVKPREVPCPQRRSKPKKWEKRRKMEEKRVEVRFKLAQRVLFKGGFGMDLGEETQN